MSAQFFWSGRWLVAVVLALAITFGVFLAAPLLRTKQAKVSSMVLVFSKQPFVLHPQADPDQQLFAMYCKSQAALVKSRFVLNMALKQTEPVAIAKLSLIQQQPDPVLWLEKQITVEFPSPETMHIGMKGDNVKELIAIIDAVTKAYLEEIVERDNNRRLDRLEQLKRVYQRLDDKITKTKADLRMLTAGAEKESRVNEVKPEEILEVKRELRRVRLAQAGEKARLDLFAKEPAKVEKIKEKLAELAAQEKVIQEELAKFDNMRLNKSNLDLEYIRDDLARNEAYRRKVAVEIDLLEIEKLAPKRIAKLEDAVVRTED